MIKEKWVHMPHAGHFIGSLHCRFHLNTYVGRYIVSTVGDYWPERRTREIHAEVHDLKWYMENKDLKGYEFDMAYMDKFGYEDIGWDRKYETMVFHAHKGKDLCCPYRAKDWSEIDYAGYKTAKEAVAGHNKLCNKWSKK
jgi:hypothetical protein